MTESHQVFSQAWYLGAKIMSEYEKMDVYNAHLYNYFTEKTRPKDRWQFHVNYSYLMKL